MKREQQPNAIMGAVKLKIGQVNVRRQDLNNLITLATSKNYDLLLLSEVSSLLSKGSYSIPYLHHQSSNFDCGILIINKNINYSIKKSHDNYIGIYLPEYKINIYSFYVRPIGSTIKDLHFDQVLEFLRNINSSSLIGGDFNARHMGAGDVKNNSRGNDLTNLCNIRGWRILNTSNTFTFKSSSGSSTPDWSMLANSRNCIANWSIDEDFSGISDHEFINITLSLDNVHGCTIRKIQQISTKTFIQEISKRTANTPISEWSTHFLDSIQAAQMVKHHQPRPSYWSLELIKKKNKLNKERIKIKNKKLPTSHIRYIRYREANDAFKRELKESITNYWSNKLSDTSNFQKCLKSLKPPEINHIIVDNNMITDGHIMGVNVLNFHFPTAESTPITFHSNNSTQDPPFSHLEIIRALDSFDSGKAPGEDGVNSTTIKAWYKKQPEYLLKLFNFWYNQQIYPEELKDTKIILLTKHQDKPNTVQNTRPIGLLSVLGKVYEKLLETRLKFFLHTNKLLVDNQYGFRPKSSTINALYNIQQSIPTNKKSFTSMISYDMAGAFNGITHNSIVKTLAEYGWQVNYLNIIKSYFTNRTVSLTLNNQKVSKTMNAGIIQGSKLSPTLFIIGINNLLKHINTWAQAQKPNCIITISAYADDITATITNNSSHSLNSRYIQQLTTMVEAELNKLGLKLNQNKTQLIHFKHKLIGPTITLNNFTLTPNKTIKVLGLLFDQKITFMDHLDYVNEKAMTTINNFSRLNKKIKNNDRKMMKHLTNTMVVSKIKYAAGIWLNNKHKAKLKKINKAIMKATNNTWSTASYAASLILSPSFPVYWQVKIHAQQELIRVTKQFRNMTPIEYIHPSSIHFNDSIAIVQQGYLRKQSDFIYISECWRIYTDGSKYTDNADKKVGAAFIVYNYGEQYYQQLMQLEPISTVFDAEWLAIESAIDWCTNIESPAIINLFTDSQSCLSALSSEKVPTTRTLRLLNKIHLLESNNLTINLWHCKAHTNISGNIAVDLAAKQAAVTGQRIIMREITNKQIKRILYEEATNEINTEYTQDKFGQTIKQFSNGLSDPRNKLMCITNYTSKLYSGHFDCLEHLHRFGMAEDNLCSCGVIQDMKHLLTTCEITRNNNLIHARKYNIENNILIDTWSTLTASRNFHWYMRDRAKSLLEEISKDNDLKKHLQTNMSHLNKLSIQGTLPKRKASATETAQTAAKKQRDLFYSIRESQFFNKKRKNNFSTQSNWLLFKHFRPNEVTNELYSSWFSRLPSMQ